MNIWNQLPLFRILFSFIAGILLALLFPDFFAIGTEVVVLSLFFFILLSVFFSRYFNKYSIRWMYGVFLNAVIFLSASQLTLTRCTTDDPLHLKNLKQSSDTILAVISNPVSERENSYKVALSVEAIKNNGEWKPCNGNVLAYFQKDSLAATLKYGDRLEIASTLNDVKAIQNPGEFDYKRYLSMRSVFLQTYVKSGKWSVLETGQGNFIIDLADNVRSKFLKIFGDYNISGDEYAVAGALILGYTDKIDQDLIDIYSGSGALHVLSVSGMHVGIIFIVLNFLLAFLDRRKKGKFIKPVILILMIWFYAAITGFSPAVNRAAAMISFVIIGKLLGRNTNIYNILAASALALLIYNPLLLADVGFQLSYIAVFGIVLLQAKINALWQPRNWLLTQIWLLISVSLAAQIATFPLGILYFHQFPNYFLLTNLLIVPFSNLIIYCGMLVLLTSPWGMIASVLSKAFVYMLMALNYSIRFIEELPYSVTHGIMITNTEAILLYLFIGFMIIYITYRRVLILRLSLISAILFFVFIGFDTYAAFVQKKIIVYNVKKSSTIDFIDGNEHVLVTDSVLLTNTKAIRMHVGNCWLQHRLSEAHTIREYQLMDSVFEYDCDAMIVRKNIVQFYHKTVAFINESNFREVAETPLTTDYLVISDNIKADIEELLDSYKPKLVIIDSSNSLRKTEQWIKQCEALKVPCYAVLKSGAYVEEI